MEEELKSLFKQLELLCKIRSACQNISIPVTVNGKNCTDENGCTELNNKDSINLLNKEHTATIYKPEPYYYDPRV